MKRKIIAQPAALKQESAKHLTIKIKQTLNQFNDQIENIGQGAKNDSLSNVLKGNINQIKHRIQRSNKLLQQSKKQARSSQKVVLSDYLPLSFRYETQKPYFTNFTLQKLDERESEYSHENEQQGSIQMPIHLSNKKDEKEYMTERQNNGDLSDNKFSSRKKYFTEKQELNPVFSAKTQRIRHNQLYDSYKRKDLKIQTEEVEKNSTKKRISGYKKQYQHLKQFSRSKQKLGLSFQQQKYKSSKKNLQLYLNNSRDQLLKSIDKIDNKKTLQSLKSIKGKIKVKLNTSKKDIVMMPTSPRANFRPRYQINMPQVTVSQMAPLFNQKSQELTKNGWEQLKEKVERYQFVRKYLTQSDIYNIYEHLKKNHINQQKWPLFVVDEAYKRMNLLKTIK